MGKISGVVERETALKRWFINQGLITRDSAVVYPNFIHFHQQSKHRRTQPLAMVGDGTITATY